MTKKMNGFHRLAGLAAIVAALAGCDSRSPTPRDAYMRALAPSATQQEDSSNTAYTQGSANWALTN